LSDLLSSQEGGTMTDKEAVNEALVSKVSEILHNKDLVTGLHTDRVRAYTAILASAVLEEFKPVVNVELLNRIITFSNVHDIGKLMVPDYILNKEGPLTDEEFDIIREHASQAPSLLKEMDEFGEMDEMDFEVATVIAEHHHERWDGTGYPHGISKRAIPLAARIVTLVDVYDALRSKRSYKDAFTHEEAVKIILEGDHKTQPVHFDPNILEIFRKVHLLFKAVPR
jgi:HD-GYP domain-containing protein (c-di-GMP phosphodiesterase class II)